VTLRRSGVDPVPWGAIRLLGAATGEAAERAGPRGDF